MREVTLRAIPAVEKLLQAIGKTDVPRPTAVSVIRRELAALRSKKQILEFDALVARNGPFLILFDSNEFSRSSMELGLLSIQIWAGRRSGYALPRH